MIRYALLLILSACGYHFAAAGPITVSIPYVIGDHEGELTDALASALSHSSHFRYTHGEGDWILKAKIKGGSDDRIGYRYDRNPNNQKKRDKAIGVENRKTVSVEISVIEANSGKEILGPQTVKASSDYDYTNPNSLSDFSFKDPLTKTTTLSIAFSLGQLDFAGAAGEGVLHPIYQKLAQKIVEGMIASRAWDDE